MALVKWDPFGSSLFPELAGLERRINHLTRQMLGDMGQEEPALQRLSTPVDVLTRGNDLIVRAEMPGIDPQKDVEVTVDNRTLTIRGERRQEQVQDGEQYYRMERSYGAFERSIALPENVSEADIQARYENGVLEVIIPRAAQVYPARRCPFRWLEQPKPTAGFRKEPPRWKSRDPKPPSKDPKATLSGPADQPARNT